MKLNMLGVVIATLIGILLFVLFLELTGISREVSNWNLIQPALIITLSYCLSLLVFCRKHRSHQIVSIFLSMFFGSVTWAILLTVVNIVHDWTYISDWGYLSRWHLWPSMKTSIYYIPIFALYYGGTILIVRYVFSLVTWQTKSLTEIDLP